MPWDFESPEQMEALDALIERDQKQTEMLRLNTGKPRLSLLPTAFVDQMHVVNDTVLSYEVARVMDYGSTKYAMNNWRKSGPWLKVLDSGMRHLYKLLYEGETHDEESGLHHAGHLGCNIAFLLEFAKEGDGVDDRYLTKQMTNTDDMNMYDLSSVLYLLNNWKDGGPIDDLETAVCSLALWYAVALDPQYEFQFEDKSDADN